MTPAQQLQAIARGLPPETVRLWCQVAAGCSADQIANENHWTRNRAAHLIGALYSKIGARGVADATRMAVRAGLIVVSRPNVPNPAEKYIPARAIVAVPDAAFVQFIRSRSIEAATRELGCSQNTVERWRIGMNLPRQWVRFLVMEKLARLGEPSRAIVSEAA